MRQKPVKASAFTLLPVDVQNLLIQNGAVPVNDVFFPYWDNRDKILLFYGGYGSGKSVFFADVLINRCLNDKYFRLPYGRKVFDTIRESVFKTLTDRIEERGLKHLFSYSTADNSSMVIRCKKNNNMFIPFGGDKIEKLKSIKDPSGIFCEELDQFSLLDFGVLLSRLRTEKAELQFIGAFNSTTVKEGHWLKQTFFSKETNAQSATKVFCNYTDNFFIDQKAYEDTLWIAAAFNDQKFKEIAKGEWGADDKDNTFIYAFRGKEFTNKIPGYCHITDDMQPDYSLPLILSFDFNVEPITCSVWQHAYDLSWISGLQEYRLMNSDIFELCERIMTDHPNAFFKVTGDASGKNRTAITRGNKNYFQIIKSLLKLNSKQFVLPGKNPYHANTRVLANLLFAKHQALLLNRSMHHTIIDIQNVEVDENGSIAKGKDKHKSHLLDTLLYYFWNFHLSFLKRYGAQLPKSESSHPAEIKG